MFSHRFYKTIFFNLLFSVLIYTAFILSSHLNIESEHEHSDIRHGIEPSKAQGDPILIADYILETHIKTPSNNMCPKIPRIIHQSWKSRTLPSKFQKWSDTWSILNPSYTHLIWDDTDNRRLVQLYYPWFLETFDNFTSNILRADAARLFYLHRYGGIYADLDFECLKPLDLLVDCRSLILVRMTGESRHNIPNAWMASKRSHTFWYL